MTPFTTNNENAVDTTTAHPARRYNYLLGGKDNFAADRASADALIATNPAVLTAARENRRFLQRLVAMLTAQGISQFIDIGTGLPVAPNTHEVAQALNPAARIVYVDNDPLVLAHARALLVSNPAGATAYIDADLREPHVILNHPDVRTTLDLDQPVGLLLVAVLHFIDDDTVMHHALQAFVDALAPGSYVALTHFSYEYLPLLEQQKLHGELAQPDRHGTVRSRTRQQLTDQLTSLGLQLLEPGVVPTIDWHPELAPQPDNDLTAADALCWAAVARRP